MSTTNTDQVRALNTGDSGWVWTVAFHPDGKHLVGGTNDGIQRWRLADGQEVGRQMGMNMSAVCVSGDHKWIVCATKEGASVWDGEMREKVMDVEDTNIVRTVDVSPDSTRFATGTSTERHNSKASIWSITTGQRLVGPLDHDNYVTGIRFSPSGEQIATACQGKSIQIFNSRTGDKLVTIMLDISNRLGTPLAWSNDGQQIFATSIDNKIRSFDVSTGSQLVESLILDDDNDNVPSIALAANGKFIAAFAQCSISFLDKSTLEQIGPVINEDGKQIQSIAISADSSYLASGQAGGKIAIHHLSKILPDLYGPSHVPTGEEVQQDKEPLTSNGHDSELPDSNPEHRKSSPLESETHSENNNRDLLEHEGPPALQSFDYDESMASSFHEDSHEDGAPPLVPSHTIPQSDALLPVPSTSETRPEGKLDSVESPQGHSIFKRWRQRVGNKAPASPKPERRSRKSREPADRRSPPSAPVRVEDTQEGPSRMAAASNKIIKLPTSRNKSRRKTATPKHPNKDDSRSAGHGAADTREADPVRLLLLMVGIVTPAHVPLDATSDQSIRTLGRKGPCNARIRRHLHCYQGAHMDEVFWLRYRRWDTWSQVIQCDACRYHEYLDMDFVIVSPRSTVRVLIARHVELVRIFAHLQLMKATHTRRLGMEDGRC